MREAPTTSTDSTSTDSSPRFTLGIDVGKKALEVTLLDQEGEVANTSVSNDSGGREVLLNWLEAWDASPEHTHACMEASGGFEEAVATLLHEEGYSVSLVNPRRIKGYADSQLRRSKTDSADASLLARYGQREDPRLWDPPTAAESRLRELTRMRLMPRPECIDRRHPLQVFRDMVNTFPWHVEPLKKGGSPCPGKRTPPRWNSALNL